MNKYLVTFGVGTKYRGKCVIVTATDEIIARQYVFDKYGQSNIAFIYDYEENFSLIEEYNYTIIEEIKI